MGDYQETVQKKTDERIFGLIRWLMPGERYTVARNCEPLTLSAAGILERAKLVYVEYGTTKISLMLSAEGEAVRDNPAAVAEAIKAAYASAEPTNATCTVEEYNVLLREYLKENPKPAVRKAMKAIGCKSTKMFYKLPAWVAVQSELAKGRAPRPKAVSLTKEIEAATPDREGTLARLKREQQRDDRSHKVGSRERI